MRASDEHLIRGFPIFRGVSDAVFESVIAHGEVRDSSPGEVLLREGERPEHLFVLLNGLVEAYSTHAGRTATVSFIRPPAAFIVAAVWMDQPQLTSVRTVQPCRVLSLPAAVVREAMARDQAFCAAVGLELAIRYRDILKELKNQRMRSAGERLANWLLTECAAQKSDAFTLTVSKNLLASRLGMSVEHLSRAFNQLHEPRTRRAALGQRSPGRRRGAEGFREAQSTHGRRRRVTLRSARRVLGNGDAPNRSG